MSADPSIADLAFSLRAGTTTAVKIAENYLRRIRASESSIGAFITLAADRALRDAQRADQELAVGFDRGPLHGIPFALKDNIDAFGLRTTCNSRHQWNAFPACSSEVLEQLSNAGGVLLGKLNLDEFGFGGRSPDLPCAPPRNPWSKDRSTGGSSSGSAAAVASGMVPLAVGTDTGGSVRVPAAYCGVVGFKPTGGLISLKGIVPLSESMDCCGFICLSAADLAFVLPALIGGPESRELHHSIRFLSLTSFFRGSGNGQDEDMWRGALRAAEAVGELVEQGTTDGFPSYDVFRACGAVILAGEAAQFHLHRLRETPHLFSRMTLRRLLVGACIPTTDILAALRLKQHLSDRLDELFEVADYLLAPTSLAEAPKRLTGVTSYRASPLRAMAFSVSGHPAISLPIGVGSSGLPLGIQVVGRRGDDVGLVAVAKELEKRICWSTGGAAAAGTAKQTFPERANMLKNNNTDRI